MKDAVQILTLADRSQWLEQTGRDGLPSQSWTYAHALRNSGVEPKLAVIAAGSARMLLPFFEREWKGTTDIATIFGLSGASIAPTSPAPLATWREYAASRGWVAGYIQYSPYLESVASSGEDIVAGNSVVLLDLAPAEPMADAADSVRAKIRAAAKDQVPIVDDRARLSAALQELYPATMRRVEARPQYAFSAETLRGWAEDPSAVVLGAEHEGRIDAVSVFLVAGRYAEYHVNASTAHGRDSAAWLVHHAIHRLRDRGVTSLNLGGGARRGDGLFQFKMRFGGTEKVLQAARQIYDRATYDALCGGANADAGWFPPYRATRALP